MAFLGRRGQRHVPELGREVVEGSSWVLFCRRRTAVGCVPGPEFGEGAGRSGTDGPGR